MNHHFAGRRFSARSAERVEDEVRASRAVWSETLRSANRATWLAAKPGSSTSGRPERALDLLMPRIRVESYDRLVDGSFYDRFADAEGPVASAYLLSAAPNDHKRFPKAFLDLEHLRQSARADRFRVHHLAETPEEADLIIFVEVSSAAGHYFERVRRHPIYRFFHGKSYLFSSTDRIVPFLPGIYASVERSWYWPNWARSGHYLGIREDRELRYEPNQRSPSYLFSFVGLTKTHPVRRRLVELRHHDALVIDTEAISSEARRRTHPPPTTDEYRRRYADSIRDSAFVLCPRGGGTATFRLFETMMVGRAPVIVSDEWVPPEGPNWENFSLRVKEAEVARIPAMLEAYASEAASMGETARAAWLDWFSEQSSFHRVVDWCLDLEASASSRAGVRRYAPYVQMLRPYHSARWVAKRLGLGD
jgi:hypothetical protein